MFPVLIFYEHSHNFAIIERPEDVLIGISYRVFKMNAVHADLKMANEIYALGQKNPVQYPSGGRD